MALWIKKILNPLIADMRKKISSVQSERRWFSCFTAESGPFIRQLSRDNLENATIKLVFFCIQCVFDSMIEMISLIIYQLEERKKRYNWKSIKTYAAYMFVGEIDPWILITKLSCCIFAHLHSLFWLRHERSQIIQQKYASQCGVLFFVLSFFLGFIDTEPKRMILW